MPTKNDNIIRWPAVCLIATLGLFSPSLSLRAATSAEAKLGRPTPEQAAWQDLELGVFIHYDIPVFKPGWDHRQYEQRPDASLFNPRKLNTDQWMEAAKAMGARYAVFVAKHGSGFMCWQSDLYPYGMKQSPYQNGQGQHTGLFAALCLPKACGARPCDSPAETPASSWANLAIWEAASPWLAGSNPPPGAPESGKSKYTTNRIGGLRFEKAGSYKLAVKPNTPPAWKVIGLKTVVLTRRGSCMTSGAKCWAA